MLVQAELAYLSVVAKLHHLVGEAEGKALAVDLYPGDAGSTSWRDERSPPVGHPIDASLSKGREHLRVSPFPVEADHDRAFPADLDELVDHRGEVDRQPLRLRGRKADRPPGAVDDEGVVPSPLG